MATGVSKKEWKDYEESISATVPISTGVVLSYPGKVSEDIILSRPAIPLKKLWDNASNNSLYYGENLEVLTSLLHNPEISGKVRLIYIDPPFASNSVFKSRNQKDAYTDLLSGANYIEFIRERLIILRELLASDGSIYVHLDGKMVFHVKLIMDEIFGSSNFRNFITRKKCNPKNYTRKTYGNVSDYILFYTKSNNYVWHRAIEEWTEEKSLKEYPYTEEKTGRRYKKVPIHAPGTRNGETGKPWRGVAPPIGKHWQYKPTTLEEMDAKGEIYWSANGNPRRKVYLENSAGIPVQDIWLDFRDAHNQNAEVTGYPTEKNRALLERIITTSSNPQDIVLDCFAGSGTSLVTASSLGRQWQGIDNSIEAIYTILKRFAKGSERMGDFVNKHEPSEQQLTLFKEVIDDFSFLTTEKDSEVLDNFMRAWHQWLE